jgi:hypothetical protein
MGLGTVICVHTFGVCDPQRDDFLSIFDLAP